MSFGVLSLSLCCGLAVEILWGMQSLKTTHTRVDAVVAAQTATHWSISGLTLCTKVGQRLPGGKQSGLVMEGQWFEIQDPWG